MAGQIQLDDLTGAEAVRVGSLPLKLGNYLRPAQDYRADALDNPVVGSPWEAARGTVGQLPYDIALLQIACAEDHLNAAASLIAGGIVPRYALYSLLRGAAEAAARAAWLMDPTLSAQDLIGRAGAERFYSVQEQEKITGDPQFTATSIQSLASEAQSAGVSVSYSKGGTPMFAGQRRPSMTELLEGLIPGTGNVYRRVSASAHATLYAAIGKPEQMGSQGDIWKITVDLELLLQVFSFAVRVHDLAVGRLVQLTGRTYGDWAATRPLPTF